MKNNLFHHPIDRAVTALERIAKDESDRLTLLEGAFILDALPVTSSLADVRMQLAKHLHEQLSPDLISKGDLFDIFLVLGVLWKYDPLQVSGEYLAYTLQRLVRSEVKVGGPYASNSVIDFAANLQIASFVQMVAKPLPGLDAFFDQSIKTGQFKSATLDSPYTLCLLATLYTHPEVTRFVVNHPLQTPAYRAIALATTRHHTSSSWQEFQAICSHQESTGLWPAEILINGRGESSIATTALIIKSWMICQSDNNPVKIPSSLIRQHELVARTTKQLFNTRAEPLRQSTLAAVDKICSIERTFEITLLSYFFARALKHRISLTDHHFALLGAANVCSWVAYTIYDDFLDDEGTPAQLPVANVTMRASLDCFRSVPPRQHAFEHYAAKIFTEMDEANAWEVNSCRFIVHGNTITIDRLPKYGRQAMLAARSFAHALGPMAIIIKYTKSTLQQTRYIESAFRHYLIARQLSDDLHDWKNDMEAGQASYVVIAILRDMHLRSGTYNLPVLLSNMQKQFRRTTLPYVCLLALRHINKAKQDFIKSKLLQTPNKVYPLLDELEASLHYSLDQHAKAKALVKTPVSYSP